MKKILLSILLLASLVYAQEKVTLNVPIQTDPGAVTLRLTLLHLDWPNQLVVIHLQAVDATGTNYLSRPPLEFKYEGTNAVAKMKLLNTNVFNVKSLQNKCLTMLSNDFPSLTGTISGTPE